MAARGAGETPSYKVKRIDFFGRKVPIVMQNENGPCPLLAISNVLLLRDEISIRSELSEIDQDSLVSLLANRMLETNSSTEGKDAGYLINRQQNIDDAMRMLPMLTTGVDVNVRFRRIDDFEFTPALAIFDLLRIHLVHGWLVEPEDELTSQIVGSHSYNSLVERLVELRSRAHSMERRGGRASGEGGVEEAAVVAGGADTGAAAGGGEAGSGGEVGGGPAGGGAGLGEVAVAVGAADTGAEAGGRGAGVGGGSGEPALLTAEATGGDSTSVDSQEAASSRAPVDADERLVVEVEALVVTERAEASGQPGAVGEGQQALADNGVAGGAVVGSGNGSGRQEAGAELRILTPKKAPRDIEGLMLPGVDEVEAEDFSFSPRLSPEGEGLPSHLSVDAAVDSQVPSLKQWLHDTPPLPAGPRFSPARGARGAAGMAGDALGVLDGVIDRFVEDDQLAGTSAVVSGSGAEGEGAGGAVGGTAAAAAVGAGAVAGGVDAHPAAGTGSGGAGGGGGGEAGGRGEWAAEGGGSSPQVAAVMVPRMGSPMGRPPSPSSLPPRPPSPSAAASTPPPLQLPASPIPLSDPPFRRSGSLSSPTAASRSPRSPTFSPHPPPTPDATSSSQAPPSPPSATLPSPSPPPPTESTTADALPSDNVPAVIGESTGGGAPGSNKDVSAAGGSKALSWTAIERLGQADLIENFLHSAQLTFHGLMMLHEGVKERQLCVFFRNNHFSTMFKFESELYILATDQGYLSQPNLVWEKLSTVDGDTSFVGGDFKTFVSSSPWNEDFEDHIPSSPQTEAYIRDREMAERLQQEMLLQQEEEERQARAAAAAAGAAGGRGGGVGGGGAVAGQAGGRQQTPTYAHARQGTQDAGGRPPAEGEGKSNRFSMAKIQDYFTTEKKDKEKERRERPPKKEKDKEEESCSIQ